MHVLARQYAYAREGFSLYRISGTLVCMTIAIQGGAASFHDIAAEYYFGATHERVFCDTFAQLFDTLQQEGAEIAVCAIENSLYGSITDVYDLLQQNQSIHIIGEIYLRIEQCLIGTEDATLADITEVHSHPVALAQCGAYLDSSLSAAKRVESHDTADSVRMVQQRASPHTAAIASAQAAELYGLPILARSIETNKQNYTRFVVLSKKIATTHDANKTSLVITTTHQPGALQAALKAFAEHGINLSKLQSRPIIGKAWHYMFYADVEEGVRSQAFHQAITSLERQNCRVDILGSYEVGKTY